MFNTVCSVGNEILACNKQKSVLSESIQTTLSQTETREMCSHINMLTHAGRL